MPPTPIAKPERHAGRDPEPARQVLLPHHDRDAEGHHRHEADRGQQDRGGELVGASMKASSSGIWAMIEPSSTVRRPIRSTSRPPTSVPSAPATSIAASAALRGRLARAVLVDEPDRREGLQAEVDPGAHRRRPRSACRTRSSRPRERSALRRGRRSPRRPRRCARAGAAARTPGRRRPAAGRIATISVPESPKSSTAGVIRIGPSAKPALPPTENRLMPVPRREPRRVVGVARALRVEGGDAEAADPDGDGGERRSSAPRPAPAIPIAASATPTGISHESGRRSETAPNSGWMIEDPTVTNSSSAPAAA